MKALVYLLIGVLGLFLQAAVAPFIAAGRVRPNLMLALVLVLALRWPGLGAFVFAALAGLALDSLSSGVLGVYGLSFLAVSLGARLAGGAIYEDNPVANLALVFAFTVAHGAVALGIFKFLDGGVPWWWWMASRVLPEALYTAALSPLLFWAHGRLERRLRWGREGWEW